MYIVIKKYIYNIKKKRKVNGGIGGAWGMGPPARAGWRPHDIVQLGQE